MALKMVYFSYPYSDNPEKRTGEIKKRVRHLLRKRKDLVPIIPHLAFDSLFGFPRGYTNFDIGVMELEMISRCDMVCFVSSKFSLGMAWEWAFAKWLGKKIVSWSELLDGKD